MFRRRPDLIVPIHDRRQRKRFLTLRNFLIVTVVCLVAFVVISTRSELRGLRPGEYGGLLRREIPQVEQKPMEVVHEEPPAVGDATHADPMLVQPAARAQWLEDESATAEVVPMTSAPVTTASITSGDADVAIVGGPDGVTVARKEKRRPVLSGGFGRQ